MLAKRVQYGQDGPRVASILNETVCRDPVYLFAYCYWTYWMVFATMLSSSNLGKDHQRGIVRNNLLVVDIFGLNLGKPPDPTFRLEGPYGMQGIIPLYIYNTNK